MLRFLLLRIGTALPTLAIVSIVVFALLRVIPGDPASLMLGEMADPQSVVEMREKLGLNEAIPIQFAIWVSDLLSGDLGTSIVSGQPVMSLVIQRFLVSAQIVVAAVALSSLVAVPLGMIAAWRQNTFLDLGLVAGATMFLSIPTFWLGLLLLMFLGLELGWLPVVGYVSVADNARQGLLYLAMPVMTLFMHEMGTLLRMARSSTLEVLHLDYITHARAKGLSEGAILRRHAFRNAFAPTWTLIGLVLGNLLGGIAVVETVFTIPGLGRLLVDSIFARDYPVIQGCLLLVAASYVLVNLLTDLIYPLIDPRVANQ